MLDQSLIPTRLIEPEERPPVVIKDPVPPSRFRVYYLAARFVIFLAGVLGMYLRRSYTHKAMGVHLRHHFEVLGGLWIKVGQLLSLRSDVFDAEFCHELTLLQDQATGFPAHIARQIIEDETGQPIERTFELFEDVPFAAASIGQIHRARLKGKSAWVAVKVQRPYADWTFIREMSFVRFLVGLIERTGVLPDLHWDEMLWELQQILSEEIDYHYEAGSMKRARKTLRKHKVYVPKVFRRFSTRRVLVMEFVDAVLMADYIRVVRTDPKRCRAWCQENGVDPHQVAKRLYNSLWRQLLEDNIFHGDLHPGNIILLRDSRMALIDFGSVGSMEREYQQKYRLLMQAMATRDFAKAADLLFLLSGALPSVDITAGKQALIRALRAWELRTFAKGLPYKQRSMSNVANELIKILFQHECAADWSFLRITRAQETVDQSLMHLWPEVNYVTLTAKYFQKVEWRERKRAVQPVAIARYANNAVSMLTLPERISELTMFQSWIVRRSAQIFQGSTSKVAQVGAKLLRRLQFGLAGVGIYVFLAFLYQHHPEWVTSVSSRDWSLAVLKAFPPLSYGTFIVLQLVGVTTFEALVSMNRSLHVKERAQH